MTHLRRWLFLIALGVAGGLILRHFLFEGIYIASPSMEPTLPVGAHYFVDKVTYWFRWPKRGEIVVFPSPVHAGKDLVKRVIGLPGETIELRNKHVLINGQPLEEPYVRFKRADELLVGDNMGPLNIPKDSFFLMGDNRDESGDSRDWKKPDSGEYIYFIPRHEVKGRILDPLQ